MRSFLYGANIHVGKLAIATTEAGAPIGSPEPTVQATSLVFSAVTATTMTVSWTTGNGNKEIVVIKASGAVDSDPVDDTTYTANAAFGSGTQIGTGNYVVYASTGATVDVTGLTAGTTYHVAIYAYNDSEGAGTENYLGTPLTGNQATDSLSDWVVLAQYAPSGASSQDVDWSSFDTTYDQFEVRFIGMEGSVDGAQLTVQGLFSGTPDTGTDYAEHLARPTSAATTYAGDGNGGATSLLASAAIGSAAGESYSGVLTAFNPTSTSLRKLYNVDGSGVDSSGESIMTFNGAFLNNTGASDGVRVGVSSGTFSGAMTLVGRKNVSSPSGVTGGPWDFVATYTPTAAASQDVTLGSAAAYMVIVENAIPVTDGQGFVYQALAPTVQTANYKRHVALSDSDSDLYSGASGTPTSIVALVNSGSAAGENGACVIYVDNPASAATYAQHLIRGINVDGDGFARHCDNATHWSGGTAAVAGLRFFFASGNIASANITVYALSETSGSAWDHVSSTTLTASASQDITLTGAADGDQWMCITSGVKLGTDGATINMQLGSSGIDTGNNYGYHANASKSDSATYVGVASTGADQAATRFMGEVGVASTEAGFSLVHLSLPGNSNYATTFGVGASADAAGLAQLTMSAGHNANLTTTLDTIRLLPSSGNFAAGGKVHLFKLKSV